MNCHVTRLLTAMSESSRIKVNYFCLGAALIFIGSVLLCTLGFTVVLPYESTRRWPEVLCSVINSSYADDVCSCDDQLNVYDTCVSKYPCLQIQVLYTWDPSPPSSTPGRVPESSRLKRIWGIGTWEPGSPQDRPHDDGLDPESNDSVDQYYSDIDDSLFDDSVQDDSSVYDASFDDSEINDSAEKMSRDSVKIKYNLDTSKDRKKNSEGINFLNNTDFSVKGMNEYSSTRIYIPQRPSKETSDRAFNPQNINFTTTTTSNESPTQNIITNFKTHAPSTTESIIKRTNDRTYDVNINKKDIDLSTALNNLTVSRTINKKINIDKGNENMDSIDIPVNKSSNHTRSRRNIDTDSQTNSMAASDVTVISTPLRDFTTKANLPQEQTNTKIVVKTVAVTGFSNITVSPSLSEFVDLDVLVSSSSMTLTDSPEIFYVARLYRSWDDSFKKECSITECGDETWNIKESRRFKSDWGEMGKTFPCYYNPSKPGEVIIEKTSMTSAIHAVVWPSVCLGLGMLLWIGLCLGCWSFNNESAHKDDYGPLYS